MLIKRLDLNENVEAALLDLMNKGVKRGGLKVAQNAAAIQQLLAAAPVIEVAAPAPVGKKKRTGRKKPAQPPA